MGQSLQMFRDSLCLGFRRGLIQPTVDLNQPTISPHCTARIRIVWCEQCQRFFSTFGSRLVPKSQHLQAAVPRSATFVTLQADWLQFVTLEQAEPFQQPWAKTFPLQGKLGCEEVRLAKLAWSVVSPTILSLSSHGPVWEETTNPYLEVYGGKTSTELWNWPSEMKIWRRAADVNLPFVGVKLKKSQLAQEGALNFLMVLSATGSLNLLPISSTLV